MTIHFGIVGCGHIAKKHVEAIKNADAAELVAVCDNNTERLEEFENAYQVKGYRSLEEMIENEKYLDVVNICTPSGYHAEIAKHAAKAKKHVLVEKPIALTLEDAVSILNICKENNVKLSVVHPNRFRPAVSKMKEAMVSGKFGILSHANATVRWNRNQAYYDQAAWRGTKLLDGGVLMNQAIHNLDLLTWLMGPVEEVQAYAATRVRNIEAEDVAVASLKFQNGALGVVEAATTIYPKNLEESISIFGESGSAIISGPTGNWIKHWEFQSDTAEDVADTIRTIEADPFGKPGHECIIEDMVLAIKENREPVVSGQDGIEALKLVLAIYKAAELNVKVLLKDLV